MRQASVAISYAAMLPSTEPDTKVMLVHNKNDELFVPKDDNLDAWKRQYIIPWGALFDLFIILLYIFFALTYQSTKIRFFLKFQSIFDNFFMESADDDSDGLVLLYFRDDVIDAANASAYKFFDFAEVFPSQDPFTEASNISLTVALTNGTEFDPITITRETLDEDPDFVADLFDEILAVLDNTVLEMDYLLTRTSSDAEFLTTITYSISFTQVRKTGIVEWESSIVGTDTTERGDVVLANQLSVTVFPIALVIVDSVAILLTCSRFISFFKHAREYATKNYLTLTKALLWKMDTGELFNLFYQVLTLVSVVLFIVYVNNDFGGHQELLILLSCAAFLHCIGLFKHLKMKKETWFVARLIFKSLGRTLLFVLGFVPFYYAWTIIGISLFGQFSYLFKGFLRTLKIMFSMMHTDVCMDTQEALKVEAAIPESIVTIFVASWLMLTGGMVINILIAIVENTLEELIVEDD